MNLRSDKHVQKQNLRCTFGTLEHRQQKGQKTHCYPQIWSWPSFHRGGIAAPRLRDQATSDLAAQRVWCRYESSKVQIRRHNVVQFRLGRMESLAVDGQKALSRTPLWACFGPHFGAHFASCVAVCLADFLPNSAKQSEEANGKMNVCLASSVLQRSSFQVFKYAPLFVHCPNR